MIIFKEASSLAKYIETVRGQGQLVGFVPTMGALHSGHLSLIQLCNQQNDVTVCSIFVNPTQFNDPVDYQKYPVTIENDIYLLEENNASVLFLPSVEEMYPEGAELEANYQLGYLETILEGAFRPGHFQGVCQVVDKLLNMVKPDNLYLGQKDYQQCMVLQKMVDDLKMPVKINIAPTQRETDGLAMSSRNTRLSPDGRKKALAISQMLNTIKAEIKDKSIERLKEEGENYLLSHGFEKVDYIEICDANTLKPIDKWNGQDKLIALTAAFIEGVRLIDNMQVAG